MFYIRIGDAGENLLNVGVVLLENFKIYGQLSNLTGEESDEIVSKHIVKFCDSQIEDFLQQPDHKLFLRDFLIVLLLQSRAIETMFIQKCRVLENVIKKQEEEKTPTKNKTSPHLN